PCYCTSVGKAVLAFQPEETIDRIIAQGLHAYTENTIVDPARLREDLRLTRERGYSVSRGEMDQHETCVGAPVRNAAGRVIAGLSSTNSSRKMTEARIADVSVLVTEHAARLSTQLGYREGGEA
ncbi:IclR family transcriptional regulator, partial [Thioclava sp. BHET1]